MTADLNAMCRCGGPRWVHAGRTGAGRCLGHALPPVDAPPLNEVGVAALGEGAVDPVMPPDAERSAACPSGCARFRWDPSDRLTRRAVAAAADEPSVALRKWSTRRNRARSKTKAKAGPGWSVGPSDHSSCHKAIEYRERPPADYVPVPISKDAADVGTMLHEEITRARRYAYPWRRFKVAVTAPGLDRPGEADEVDDLIGRVTDYKSAGDWKWEQVGKDGPPESEWKQVATYALGLAEDGFTPVDLEIVYINRENGRTERFLRDFDKAYAQAALAELHGILDALDEGRELPRVRAGDELLGPTVNALCARYCPAVRHCWSLPDVPADRTPEGWLLARDDEDGAITTTLETYVGNREVETAAKKQRDYARVLLAGVEPGRYGEITLGWSGGNLGEPKPDDKARIAQLETELAEAATTGRPPRAPVDLPYPTVRKRSNVTIRVNRVRAATLERESR